MPTSPYRTLDTSPAQMLNKVPLVTLTFWVVKILSTTVGETGADYLAVHVGAGQVVTDICTLVLLTAALIVQLRSKQYVPWKYWLVVVLLSIAGTQITDALTDGLGISLYYSTAGFAAVLGVIFAAWHARERTLSITSITTRSRELFYWSAILFTFALGTAAGDLATEAVGLGFTVGAIVFGALIGAIALAYRLGAPPVLAFWIAYILTRPLGASLGDLLSQARTYGGFGLGTVLTSAVFLFIIVALVVWMTLHDRAPVETTSTRAR